MTVKVFSDALDQTAADTTTIGEYQIQVNSFSPLEPPMLRLLALEWYIVPSAVVTWTPPCYFEFEIAKVPKTNKSVVFSHSITVLGASAVIENSGVWYPPAQGIPLVYGDQVEVRIDSNGTGAINTVGWRLFYEEVVNPTEMELTLGVIA